MTTLSYRREGRTRSLRLLLACGIIGPLLFVSAFFIEGATRVDYNPLRHPVSALSIGASGWVQIANFIVTGALLIGFALGLRQALWPSVWGPLLLGSVGVSLIGAGIFVADPLNGYPLGTPALPTARTVHGLLHDLFGVPVFLGVPIACVVVGRRLGRAGERGWAVYSILTGLAMFAVFVLARLGFSQRALAAWAGAFQRGALVIGFSWIALLAAHTLRLPIPTATQHTPHG